MKGLDQNVYGNNSVHRVLVGLVDGIFFRVLFCCNSSHLSLN